MTPQEIETLVFERFPKIKEERTCATERLTREAARKAYREKLNEQARILREAHSQDEQV